jgi:hypothetical protein
MLVYFFGNPTLELSGQAPSSSTVPQQIPQPSLSPQLSQDQPILKPPTEAPKPVTMSTSERTFIAIKPDGVQRGLVGNIIARFETRGFKLVALKLVSPGKAHLEQHYADLSSKPFFADLVTYMNSGPIVAMVWEGLDAVKTGRGMDPLVSPPFRPFCLSTPKLT